MFGIESGIEALLSPTHLWLFVAGALMLSGPIRAALARRDTGAAPTGPGLAAAVLAATSLAGLAGFALSFLSAYLTDAPSQPVPHFPEGTAEHAAVEIPASWGLASYLVTSLVLAMPLAYLILRWRLPFGTVTCYATSLALLAVTLADFHRLYAVPATAGRTDRRHLPARRPTPGHRGTPRRSHPQRCYPPSLGPGNTHSKPRISRPGPTMTRPRHRRRRPGCCRRHRIRSSCRSTG